MASMARPHAEYKKFPYNFQKTMDI
jgi:hypothetical protein